MPNRRQGRKRKPTAQEIKDIQLERQNLRQKLEERQLYKPRMQLQEMRDLYMAIEQSMEEYEIHTDVAIHEEIMANLSRNHQKALMMYDDRQQRAILDPTMSGNNHPMELGPIFENSEPLIGEMSPPPLGEPSSSPRSPTKQVFEGFSKQDQSCIPLSEEPDVDSDSDTEYSPDNPGLCCRMDHLVLVEIHPEPREDNDDDQLLPASNNSQSRSRRQSNIDWDAIDEFI